MGEENRANLIVNYIPQNLSDTEFENLFRSIGPLKSSKIIRHKATGCSYGFGFVEYVDVATAAKAIQKLNGYQMENKMLKVAYARPRSDNIKHANLYVRGIPRKMNQEEVEKIFAECGGIIQCRVLKDTDSDGNKGIAFVLFDKREHADEAIAKFNGQKLPGSTETLSVKYAEDNSKKVPPVFQYMPPPLRGGFGGGPVRPGIMQNRYRFNPLVNVNGSGTPLANEGHILFVYNIGEDVDERGLYHLFSSYGTVVKSNVIRESSTNQSKGYGFVTMHDYNEAVWAIECLNGFNFSGKPLQVSFKTPKQ